MKFRKIAFLFPGQGAQVLGMGKDFYQAFAEAKEVFDEGEAILNTSIKNFIFEGPEDLLKETRRAQTAIYLTSLALYRVLRKQFPILTPYLTAGLSLGEYSALTAAQILSFQECLPLVQYRGECMHEACEKTQGTMAAILGLSSEIVREINQKLSLRNDLWVANFNSSEQTVISGTLTGVEKGSLEAKELGAKRVIPLKVHGAFHSGLMQSAKDKLQDKISNISFKESSIAFIMNVTGSIIKKPHEVRDLLIQQVTESVQWQKSMKTVQEEQVDLILEVGPGKTLGGLAKQNGLQVPILSINKIEDLDTLYELLQ